MNENGKIGHGGSILPRADAINRLALQLVSNRKVIYCFTNAAVIDAIKEIPMPYTVFIDDGDDTLPVIDATPGCRCPTDVPTIYMECGILTVLIIAVPSDTDLSAFGKAMEATNINDIQAHHKYLDVGMRHANGATDMPLLLMAAMDIGDPRSAAVCHQGATEYDRRKAADLN